MLIKLIVALAEDPRARNKYDENAKSVFEWFDIPQQKIEQFFAGSPAEQNQMLLDEINALRAEVSGGQPLFWSGRDMEPKEITPNPVEAGDAELTITGNYLPPKGKVLIKVVGGQDYSATSVTDPGKVGSVIRFTATGLKQGTYTVQVVDTSQQNKMAPVPADLVVT